MGLSTCNRGVPLVASHLSELIITLLCDVPIAPRRGGVSGGVGEWGSGGERV